MHSRPVYADDGTNKPMNANIMADIRSRFKELNKRDANVARQEKQKELLGWKVVKGDNSFLTLNEELVQELLYIKCFYDLPLSPNQKVRIRNKLLELYEKDGTTEQEKECIQKVMNYYKLFE